MSKTEKTIKRYPIYKMSMAGFLIMNGHKPDEVVQDVMIGKHKKKWCFYFKDTKRLRTSLQVYYGSNSIKNINQKMVENFVNSTNSLMGTTVWTIDSHEYVKEIKINRHNIWKIKELWEQKLLFFSVKDAENYQKQFEEE